MIDLTTTHRRRVSSIHSRHFSSLSAEKQKLRLRIVDAWQLQNSLYDEVFIRNPESATRKHNNRSAVINNRSAVINNWPVTNKVCSSHKYCTIVFHCCDINKFWLCHKYVSVSVRTPTNSSAGYFFKSAICFALRKFSIFGGAKNSNTPKIRKRRAARSPHSRREAPKLGLSGNPKEVELSSGR